MIGPLAKTLNDITKEATGEPLDPAQLEDIVYDAAIRLASRANNEGLKEQLRFLTEVARLSDKEIIDAFKTEL